MAELMSIIDPEVRHRRLVELNVAESWYVFRSIPNFVQRKSVFNVIYFGFLI